MLKVFLVVLMCITHRASYAIDYVNKIDNPRPEHWPGSIWRKIIEGSDLVIYSISGALFDSVSSFDIKLTSRDYVRADLKIKRKVYDNQDVLSSYTVMDYFNLDVKSQNLTIEAPISLPNISFGLSLGIKGSMEWLNIRQVLASGYSKLPTINDSLDKNSESDERVLKLETDEFWDPSLWPRVSMPLNLITFPFKIPLTPKQFSYLADGELISWSINGYVELGPDVGFRVLPTDLTTVNGSAKVYFRNFLKGSFRVTILKENNRYVRVKLTKLKGFGERVGVGPDNSKFELFEGFLVFEGSSFSRRILQQNASLIPFQFELRREQLKTFDVGYRFDLENPKAKEAFYHAVWGSFHKAYKLQGRKTHNGNIAVERLFRKKSKVERTNSNQKLDLTFYTRNLGKKSESTKASILLKDGYHQVFKEVTSMDKEWKMWFGRFEKLNYSFTISLDKTAYLEGKENSFQLVAEANILDSHTNGPEMVSYLNTVEKALGNKDLLPDLPRFVPLYRRFNTNDDYIYPDNIGLKLAKYRRSSFYYGFNITQDQLEQFVKTPKDRMWSLLEKSFGISPGIWSSKWRRRWYRIKNLLPSVANIPLFLANIHLRKGSDVEAANKIYKRWLILQNSFKLNSDGKLKLNNNIENSLKNLSQIFEVKYYGHELLRLLLFSLEDNELDYFLVATNNSFGRIQQRGKVTTNPEYLLNLTDASMDFERRAGGFKPDPNLVIKNLRMEVLPNENIKIKFHLNHSPKLVYFKLFKANRFQKYKVIAELAYRNIERFKKGDNELIISKDAIDELEYTLGEPLVLKNFYNLTVSTSDNGLSWGKVASKRLYYDLFSNKEIDIFSNDEITEEIYEWEKEILVKY